jgi:hypothetical protein
VVFNGALCAGDGEMFGKAAIWWAPVVLVLACGLSESPTPEAGRPEPDPPPPGGASGSAGAIGGAGGQAGRDPEPDAGRNPGRDAAAPTGGRAGADAGRPTADAAPAAPPSSNPGPQISINGTLVPKEKVIVFLHIGHSNMAGRVTTPQSLRPFNFETHPQLWAYGKGGVWKAAKEPLSPDSMAGNCGGVGCAGLPFGAGPGMSILRTALAAAPDAHIVSIGRGQSGLTGGYCRNFRKGGLLYDFVMGPAMELKGKVTFGAIWTMFGQSEVNDSQNNSRFGDCMVGVANDMRTDLGEPELPFLVGDWEQEARGGLSANSGIARVIIPQMRALPMRISRSVVIPTDGLPVNPLDNQHFDLTGHKLWAERGFALLKMNGWTPWAGP